MLKPKFTIEASYTTTNNLAQSSFFVCPRQADQTPSDVKNKAITLKLHINEEAAPLRPVFYIRVLF